MGRAYFRAGSIQVGVGLLVLTVILLTVSGQEALAKASPPGPGCANANAGVFDGTSPATSFTIFGGSFNQGETVVITTALAAGGPGAVTLTEVTPAPTTTITTQTVPFSVSYVVASTGNVQVNASYPIYIGGINTFTYTVRCIPVTTADITPGLIKNYISGHWNPLLSVFSEHRTPLPFQSRDRDDVFQDGTGITPNVSGDNSRVAFGGSVQGFNAILEKDLRVAAAAAGVGNREPQRWDLWIKGVITDFDADDANAARKGDAFVLLAGVDYLLRDDVLVGVLVGYDTSDQKISALDSEFDTEGFVVGPYASVRLTEELTFYARAAVGLADHDIRVGTTTGEFDSERLLLMANLKGTYWDLHPVRLTPNVMVQYVIEDHEAFTDSAGTRIDSQTVELGRLEIGGEVGYRVEMDNGVIVDPYVSLHGLYDFQTEGRVAVSQTVSTKQGTLRARVGGGVTVNFGNGAHAQVGIAYDGIGEDDYEAVSGHARVAIPLD